MLSVKSIRSLRDFRRKTSKCFYEAWQLQNLSLRCFCFTTQRVIFTNLLLFRHSGSLVFRRLNERYWSLHTSWRKELRLIQAQRILLGGCLISFAQDKITDEELMSTIKNFTTNPDRVPDIPDKLALSSVENLQSESNQSSNSSYSIDQASPDKMVPRDPFTNPPLTLIVRQLRKELSQLTSEFMRPKQSKCKLTTSTSTEPEPDNCDSSGCKTSPEDKPAEDTVSDYFSTVLSNLDFRPDGTGFVDDTWDLIINRQDLRIWRRPIESSGIIKAQAAAGTMTALNGAKASDPRLSGNPNARYEYRLCGTMTDISALSFLEVQLNLSYRRHWDDRVVSLEYLNRSSDTDDSVGVCPTGDLIRWVARFPFPLAQREYVYARRWWLESAPSPEASANKTEVSEQMNVSVGPSSSSRYSAYGRHALVLSRSCIPSDRSSSSARPGENGAGSTVEPDISQSWINRLKPSTVLVTTYRSEMLIQSHGQFDELGLNYYLIYYDDPRLPVGDSTFSVVTGKAMNQFISQLHSAALALNQRGMPPGIDPIVFHSQLSRTAPTSTTEVVDQPEPPDDPCFPDSADNPESKPRFFADYVADTSHNISDVAY